MEFISSTFWRCIEYIQAFFERCSNLFSGKSPLPTLESPRLAKNSQTCDTHDGQIHDMVYVGLNPESEINGKKLDSIVRYALNEMSISKSGSNAEETYRKYCSALNDNLGFFEPYQESANMQSTQTIIIAEQMRKWLGSNAVEFSQLVENSIAEADTNLRDGILRPSLFYTKESIITDFVALMISQSGDSLEFTPCYMGVREKWIRVERYFLARLEQQCCMQYLQQKYILNKFDIIKICAKLDTPDVNTPLRQVPIQSFGSISNDCE